MSAARPSDGTSARGCSGRQHGSPAGGATALLLVDFINPLDFEQGEALRPAAEAAAARTAALKRRLAGEHIPAIYANDNFGRWRSDFSDLVETCAGPGSRGRELARLLRPERDDLSILKPRHSAFFGTPLEFLLTELDTRRLIIAGLVTEMCVLFTAQDAYVRKFALWVPRDCVASVDPEVHARTLAHLEGVLGADTRATTEEPTLERTTAAGE